MGTDIEVVVDPAAISTAVTVDPASVVTFVTLSVGVPGPAGPIGPVGPAGPAGSYDQSLNTTNSPRFNDLEIDQLGGGSLAGVIQNLGNSIPTDLGQLSNRPGYITGLPQPLDSGAWPNFNGVTWASGYKTANSALYQDGSIRVGWNGSSYNNQLNPDGSGSFAAGALTIDSSGNLTATNFTPSAYLTDATAFDAAGSANSALSTATTRAIAFAIAL